MAQYDIYRLRDGRIVCDLQTDLLPIPSTRVVAPLRNSEHYVELSRLTPTITLNDEKYVIRIQEIAAIPERLLSHPIESAEHLRDDLTRALDILFHGL